MYIPCSVQHHITYAFFSIDGQGQTGIGVTERHGYQNFKHSCANAIAFVIYTNLSGS